MLAVGLPQIDSTNNRIRDWTDNELVQGQTKTLLLLAENQSPYFGEILNRFSHFISEKLLFKLIPLVARTRFGNECLETLLQSMCFKGHFYERVTNHGLLNKANSFECFFEKFLLSAANSSKASANTIINELQKEPYNLAFGLYMKTTPW